MRNLLLTLTTIIFLGTSAISFAKSLSLYEQPQTNAKVTAAISEGTALIPIFQPKNSEWIKVADASNGNVGWTKVSDLEDFSGIRLQQTVMTHTEKGKGVNNYNVYSFGSNTQRLKPAEVDALIKQIQKDQLQFQKDMSELFTKNFFNFPFPMMTPVIMVPVQDKPKNTNTVPENIKVKSIDQHK